QSLLSSFNFNNKFVLDFGCGIGSSSFMFHPDYYVGIDCDDKRIAYANHLYKKYKFISCSGNKLLVDDRSIDYILLRAVLHHIPSDVINEYLQEFSRVLKSGGQIIVIEPCFFSGSIFRNRCMSFFDKGKYIRSELEYLNLFHQHNYETKTIDRFNQCLMYNEILFTAKF
ncbi:class I SAM-dependent methyltransferase, partial [Anaerosolibacter sp.]|uniref:class I SAM-dependent methyltransferase n=1 Tax=Anaerosolibacter sp. TaxID=1872527 RepID=UPI0039F0EBCB